MGTRTRSARLVWARLKTPFGLALLASLLMHVQAYWGLAKLPKAPPPGVLGGAGKPVEIAFEVPADMDATALGELPDTPARPSVPRLAAPRQQTPVRPTVAEAVPPEPADPAGRTAVTQRSQNPEPPPEDARFMAEENNRVEEETVAEFTNDQQDDAVQQLAREELSAEEGEGNAEETVVAATRGDESETPEDGARPSTAPPPSGQPQPPAGAALGEGAAPAHVASSPAAGAAPSEGSEVLTVTDGAGTFRVPRTTAHDPRPASPLVAGEHVHTGTGPEGEAASQAAARTARGVARGTGPAALQPNLALTYGDLAAVTGQERLDADRAAWVNSRRARLRGSDRAQRWRRFRSAIENYVAQVRPGNQTALNAAASPFAQYLAVMHRKIHRHFAHGFLGGLPNDANHPLSDRSLLSRLEIILNRDGSIHRVGVVRTSGNLMFDQGAFASVHNAAPYGAAPPGILSDDGKVYMHWGFYRNQRQCGTFNARPYILERSPLRDAVPGAAPTPALPSGTAG